MLGLLITIAGIHLAALASPGPDFFFISQVAASHSRTNALKAVLGITFGVAVWAAIALLGLHVLIQKISWLQKILFIFGGCYLLYLAFLLIRSAFRIHFHKGSIEPETVYTTQKNRSHLFLKGLLTNLANPKALIYFGSVFVVFVGDDISSSVRISLFMLVILETFLWFTLVSVIFSLPTMKKGYKRAAKWLDGIAGILFGTFGLHLIYQSLSTNRLL